MMLKLLKLNQIYIQQIKILYQHMKQYNAGLLDKVFEKIYMNFTAVSRVGTYTYCVVQVYNISCIVYTFKNTVIRILYVFYLSNSSWSTVYSSTTYLMGTSKLS